MNSQEWLLHSHPRKEVVEEVVELACVQTSTISFAPRAPFPRGAKKIRDVCTESRVEHEQKLC